MQQVSVMIDAEMKKRAAMIKVGNPITTPIGIPTTIGMITSSRKLNSAIKITIRTTIRAIMSPASEHNPVNKQQPVMENGTQQMPKSAKKIAIGSATSVA